MRPNILQQVCQVVHASISGDFNGIFPRLRYLAVVPWPITRFLSARSCSPDLSEKNAILSLIIEVVEKKSPESLVGPTWSQIVAHASLNVIANVGRNLGS